MTLTLTVGRSAQQDSEPGKLKRAARVTKNGLRTLVSATITPHRAAVRRLLDMPLSVGAAGCIDYASYHVSSGLGWLVTGISLVIIEHLIADDDSLRPS